MSSAGGFSGIEPIGREHVLAGFDCGEPVLNDWLVRHAMQSHAAGSSRTRVVCRDGRVVGFYSLAAGSIKFDQAPPRVARGMPRHAVPVVVLTRLAIDRSVHSLGLGRALLKDALLKVADVSEDIAVRALLVHAKNEELSAWYQARAGFHPSPSDPLQLFLLLKEIRAMIAAS